METYLEKLDLALNSNAFAVAMDVDAAGLPFLKGCRWVSVGTVLFDNPLHILLLIFITKVVKKNRPH